MHVNSSIADSFEELKAIRRFLHQNPEVGLDTVETAALIKSKLDEYGIEHEDIGANSVLAWVKSGASGRTVAFRGDIDALEIREENDFPYKSKVEGKMHACGHDGHAATMLALARYLSENRDFDGTVYLLFQSGEEGYGGALKIIEDGLFEKHKIDYMFGFHNWPGVPSGKIVVHEGACMASEDRFDVEVTGKSGHASMPHVCNEPFAAVADIIKTLQTIVVRKIPAQERSVISITQVHGGSTYNGIPDHVSIKGNVRTFDEKVQDLIEASIGQVVEGIAATYGVSAKLNYMRYHPVLQNSTPEIARRAAAKVVGSDNVVTDMPATMAAEDFAFYMKRTKGCFVWIGNGEDSAMLHNSRYDFNDEVILAGASYMVSVIEELL